MFSDKAEVEEDPAAVLTASLHTQVEQQAR
jgi:hypothetical protein